MPEAVMHELKARAIEKGYDSENAYVREALKEKLRRGNLSGH